MLKSIDEYSAKLVKAIGADPKDPNLPLLLHHHLIRENNKQKGIIVVVDNVNYNLEPLYEDGEANYLLSQWDVKTEVHIFLNYISLEKYLLRSVDLLKIKIEEVGCQQLTTEPIDIDELNQDFDEIENLIEDNKVQEALRLMNFWLGRIAPENNFNIEVFDIIPE